MSFLDRLDSFEVRADHLMLRGYQEPVALRSDRRSSILNQSVYLPSTSRQRTGSIF
jgi:hypothetical protein